MKARAALELVSRQMVLVYLYCVSSSPVAPTPSDWHSRYTKTDEQRLLYHILQGYERAVRPVTNASNPIVVKLGLTLTNIFDMDEKNQVLTTNVWLDQEWRDELLRWDPKQFGGIESTDEPHDSDRSIRVPCDLIWLPDIVLYNNADDYTTGYMRARAMVHYDGTVFWPPPTQLRSTCKIDVTYFPFDSQRCFMKFGSWTYHGFQVDVTNRSDNVDLTNYVLSGEFDLVRVHQKRRVVKYTCCPEPYPDVTFFIHVRRKTLYYMYNVVFPCMMMSALTLLVFCLPPDSGEKIALGITVLLAFSVFVLAIAEKMPETSDSMPLIGIYLTVVMAMTSVSVVMTVMVLNFHHRGPFHKEIPHWIRSLILDKLRRMLCMRLPVAPNKLLPPAAAAASAQTRRNASILRRLSLRVTLDNIQEELTKDSERIAGGYQQAAASKQRGSLAFTDAPIDLQVLGADANRRASPHLAQNHNSQLCCNSVSHATDNNNAATVRPLHDGGSIRSRQAAVQRQRSALQEEILKTLQVLISRQDLDDECEEIANEWRQVAQVIDRLLFWIFLVATITITLVLLIFIPLVRHAYETDELDEALFGVVVTGNTIGERDA